LLSLLLDESSELTLHAPSLAVLLDVDTNVGMRSAPVPESKK